MSHTSYIKELSIFLVKLSDQVTRKNDPNEDTIESILFNVHTLLNLLSVEIDKKQKTDQNVNTETIERDTKTSSKQECDSAYLLAKSIENTLDDDDQINIRKYMQERREQCFGTGNNANNKQKKLDVPCRTFETLNSDNEFKLDSRLEDKMLEKIGVDDSNGNFFIADPLENYDEYNSNVHVLLNNMKQEQTKRKQEDKSIKLLKFSQEKREEIAYEMYMKAKKNILECLSEDDIHSSQEIEKLINDEADKLMDIYLSTI